MSKFRLNLMSVAVGVLMPLLSAGAVSAGELKPRIVVLTDVAPQDVEPDDMESLVRLLAHADLFEIEALVATTGWNTDNYDPAWLDYMMQVVDAYEKDLPNLMKRSGQKGFKSLKKESGKQETGYWPSADYIRSRISYGSKSRGRKVLGDDNNSDGSEVIITLAEEKDPRPLWVLVWGGGNTVAQSLWKLKESGDTARLGRVLDKIRIYTITDQDEGWDWKPKYDFSSHKWMRENFGDRLKFIWDESAWLSQNSIGADNWPEYARLIQGKGHMGKIYPKNRYGVEGDTPSFLYVFPNGLNNPEDPLQVSWGGYFNKMLSPDGVTECYTNARDDVRAVSNKYEHYFYPAVFNSFVSRMAWADAGAGNRNPVAVVNGKTGTAPIRVKARAGSLVTLDASKTYDPDGDAVEIRWWKVPEAAAAAADIYIPEAAAAKLYLPIPADSKGKSLHVICEVTDNGDVPLTSYRRVIIDII